MAPLAEDEHYQCQRGQCKEHGDVWRAEPVVLLAFVEHDLQETDADHDQRDADVIDLDALASVPAAAMAGPRRPAKLVTETA